MRLWVRVRGLAVAGLVLGGVLVGVSIASLATASIAVAQTATSIVVEGNRRVESDTIRSYFRVRPGERLDALKVDEGIKALFATGLFADVRSDLVRRPPHRHGRREPGHQPHPVRGQQARQGRAAQRGNPVQAARRPVAPAGAGRRAAHRRDLSPQRPLRRPRRAEDHRPAEQPRRSRVRDHRRRQDHRQGRSSSSATAPIRPAACAT